MNWPFWSHISLKSRGKGERWQTCMSLSSMRAVWFHVCTFWWPSERLTSRQRKLPSSSFFPTFWIWLRECNSLHEVSSSDTIFWKWWKISFLIKVMSLRVKVVMSMTQSNSSFRTWVKWIDFGYVFNTFHRIRTESRERLKGMSYVSQLEKTLSDYPVSKVLHMTSTSRLYFHAFLTSLLCARTLWHNSISWNVSSRPSQMNITCKLLSNFSTLHQTWTLMLISRIFSSRLWRNSQSLPHKVTMTSRWWALSEATLIFSDFSRSTRTKSLRSRDRTSKLASCLSLKSPLWTSALRLTPAISPMSIKSWTAAVRYCDHRPSRTLTRIQWSFLSNCWQSL